MQTVTEKEPTRCCACGELSIVGLGNMMYVGNGEVSRGHVEGYSDSVDIWGMWPGEKCGNPECSLYLAE